MRNFKINCVINTFILLIVLYLKESSFSIGDLGEIIKKHKMWKKYLPRVEPFYGMLFDTQFDEIKRKQNKRFYIM